MSTQKSSAPEAKITKKGDAVHYKDTTPPTPNEAAHNTIVEAIALGSGVQTVIVEAALGSTDIDQLDKQGKKKP